LQELEQARSTAATEAERKKKQAEYQQAMKAGRDAVAAKRYDEAIKAFTEAGRLLPGDRDAALLLQQSAWARDEAKAAMDAEARKKQEEEKRRAEFNRLMADGRAALAAKRYDDAVKAFGEALKLQPGDRTANALLQQAARAREDAKAAMDAEARKKQDEEKRRAEFNRLMASGRQALAARRYEEAVKAFGDALKLQPGDPTATRSLREAQQALDASRPPPKPSKPSKPPQPPAPPAEYTRQMNTAQGLERQQKYAEAVRAYREALRLVPGDAQASKGGEFAQRMADGQKALAARRFADAVRAFEAALKLVPNHPDATSYLKRAREGKP
jgi:colicin import membrane protein